MHGLLFAVIFSIAGTTGAADTPQTCAHRASSLVQTSERSLPVVENWKLSAKNSTGQVSCRASQVFSDGGSGTMIYVPKGEYRGGRWFLEFSSPQRKLSRDYQGPAHLLINGEDVFVGEIYDTGASTGGKRTSTFVRAEFPKLDPVMTKLRSANKIEIRAEVKKWIDLEVPSLKVVITALEDCAAKAIGLKSQEFWKNAVSGCG